MEYLYDAMRVLHVVSFVFMSVPLFNLIVVNERALMGPTFHFHTDRYMENIIRRGAIRCYVFQSTALVSGILLLFLGPLGIETLWTQWILSTKTLLLLALTGLLSYVHFSLQPAIESHLSPITSDADVPEELSEKLKPYRVQRKKLATFCLFLVLTTIILGMQVYDAFPAALTLVLIGLSALFAWRVNKTLLRFGWF